jgi:hypothetical protein
MKGFDPGTSVGYEVVRSYDADSIRAETRTRPAFSRSGWPAEGNIHHRAGR